MKDRLPIVACLLPIATLTIICALLGGYLWGKQQMLKTMDQYELKNLARRLGVEDDWEAIRYYIYCNLLSRGKKPEQIKEELKSIGLFSWDDRSYKIFGDHITVVFENYHIRNRLGDLVLYFDENGQLYAVYKLAGTGDMVRLDEQCEE